MIGNYIVIGVTHQLPRIGGFENLYDGIDDPRTMYLHIQDRTRDTIANPRNIDYLLTELVSKAGAHIETKHATRLVVKPMRPKSIWGAANDLQQALQRHNFPYGVTALPLELLDDKDFLDVLDGQIPTLNGNGGDLRKTELYRRELEETVELVLTSHHQWVNRVNSKPRLRALKNARAYFKQYFPSDHEFNDELDDALRGTDEEEVLRVLRAYSEQ